MITKTIYTINGEFEIDIRTANKLIALGIATKDKPEGQPAIDEETKDLPTVKRGRPAKKGSK